ncbi:MAG: extracellular solute-binding protein [Clostridiales bacterium]|nr:extracellular solute-binding protein [Clostridiales bacterium]
MIRNRVKRNSVKWNGWKWNQENRTEEGKGNPGSSGGRLRRGVLAVLLVIFCVTLLTACHGSQETKEAFEVPEEFDTSRDYEITFWAKNDTNKSQVAIYEQAIEDFEALYPNITVNIRLYTDYSDIYNDVITNIATDTTPNVCITYPDHIATYLIGDNQVVPLDDLMTDEKYGLGGSELLFDSPTVDEVVPQFLEECQIDGMYYALPYMRSTEACYVNKTYVEALGFELPETLTWDFIWEVCDAAMEKDADGNFVVNGQSVMIPFIYKSTDNMMITMLKQLDAGYSTADGDVLLFNDTTTELLYEVAEYAENREFSTFKISGYPANFLNAGQCIFAVDSTAGATWMGTDAPLLDISEDKLVAFETVVMAVPQYDTENIQMISQGPSICIFNKEDSQEVLASWLFAQYLLTNDVQIAYSQTEGYLPVTTKAQESDEYQDYLSRSGEDNSTYYSVKIDAAKLLLDNIENTFTTAVFNGSTSLRSAAGQLIESTTKSARRGETIDDTYFETLYDEVTSLYRLDQIEVTDDEDSGGLKDLGPLPQTSVILLGSLAAVWVLILLYLLWRAVKARKFGGD